FPLHLTDGIHELTVQAGDLAGNEALLSETIRIDSVPPMAQFTSLIHGDVVQGEVLLTGTHHDDTSGIERTEISTDGGVNWQVVLIKSSSEWEYLWHSNEVPNGKYALLVHAIDQAGNVGVPDTIKLEVNNAPP